MELEDYNDLPEGISTEELKLIYRVFINEVENDSVEITTEKIKILCDKQWHTYEPSGDDIQKFLVNWINDNWSIDQEFLELVLLICYSFGLSKATYTRALNSYTGSDRQDHLSDLTNSQGDDIDPYWSMRV